MANRKDFQGVIQMQIGAKSAPQRATLEQQGWERGDVKAKKRGFICLYDNDLTMIQSVLKLLWTFAYLNQWHIMIDLDIHVYLEIYLSDSDSLRIFEP